MPALKSIHCTMGLLFSVLVASMILVGCSQRDSRANQIIHADASHASSENYLQQIRRSNAKERPDFQLLAIRASIREGKLTQAAELYRTLPQTLTVIQQKEALLTKAELEIAQNNLTAASSALKQLDPKTLSPAQQNRYYQIQAVTHQGIEMPNLDSLRSDIAQEPLLAGSNKQNNINKTWEAISQLPLSTLNTLTTGEEENTLRGWIALAQTYQANKQDPTLLKASIRQWQNKFPKHPAVTQSPNALTSALNYQPTTSTNKIALLLPLHGKANIFSNAIKKGFSAAANGQTTPEPANNQNSSGHRVSASGTPSPNFSSTAPVNENVHFTVYDTSSQPLETLLTQVERDGATLVVGPLLKNQVEQLSSINTRLNILALNEPEHLINHSNICYYSLSPENEAREAATHLWQKNKRKPLLLIPKGTFGERIAHAFVEQWKKEGGVEAKVQTFSSVAEMQSLANRGEGLPLDGTSLLPGSTAEPITLGDITIAPPQTEGSANTPIDAVYIVATQKEIMLIKPMLDMNGGATRPTLYASSRSYQTNSGTGYRLEMDGVEFSDIPLLTSNNSHLLEQIMAVIGNDYMQVRLYAMGMDAWSLANHFDQMRQINGSQLTGHTGLLTADNRCVINRKLVWLKYHQGQIIPAQ